MRGRLRPGVCTANSIAIMTDWWRVQGWPTPDEWQAFWGFASTVLTGLLIWIALRQLSGLAKSNRGLVESNELLAESNHSLSRPTIIVQLDFERVPMRNYTNNSNNSNVFVVVDNVGASPAVDVLLAVDPKFEATPTKLTAEGLQALNDLFSGRERFRMVAPGQRFRYILDSASDALKSDELPSEYTVTASYWDSERKRRYEESFTLQMSPWAMAVAEVDPAKQLSKDVQFISENLKSRQTGLPRIASAVRSLQAQKETTTAAQRFLRQRASRGR